MPVFSLLCLAGVLHAQDAQLGGETEQEEAQQGEAKQAETEQDQPEYDEIMVVTAARGEQKISETVVVTEVITAEDIAETGASDAAQALETAPGVQIVRTFRGAGAQMQGLDSRYVLILVNGQRVTGRSDGVYDISRIPAERIERIEVVKGSASALYGSDAVAGVINIILKEPTAAESVDVTGRYGSRNTIESTAGVGLKREGWALGGTLGYRQNDSHDWDPDDAQTDGNARQAFTADVHGTLRPATGLELDAGADFSRRDLTGVDVGSGGKIVDRRNLVEDASLRLGANLLAGRATRLSALALGSLMRDQYLQDQRGSDAEDSFEEQIDRLVQAELQLSRYFAAGHTLTVVGEGTTEFMSSPRLGTGEAQRYRGALAALDEWRVSGEGGRLVISPSARVDYDSIFGVAPSPRLALRFDPVETLALRASGGRSWTAPDFDQLYLFFENPSVGYQVEGNPDLEPEYANKVDGSVEISPADLLTLRLDGFYTNIDNAIDYEYQGDETPQRYVYTNLVQKVSHGGEATLSLRPAPWLVASAGYLYSDSREKGASTVQIGTGPQRATWNLTASLAAPDLTLNLGGEWVGARFFDEDISGCGVQLDEGWSPAYTHARVRAEKRLWQGRVKLYAGINNALDRGDACYAHLEPRLYYAGATMNLERD